MSLTNTTSLSNQNIIYTTTSGITANLKGFTTDDLTNFMELVLAALGYDITFQEFVSMTESQKNQLIRDIKLKTII